MGTLPKGLLAYEQAKKQGAMPMAKPMDQTGMPGVFVPPAKTNNLDQIMQLADKLNPAELQQLISQLQQKVGQ